MPRRPLRLAFSWLLAGAALAAASAPAADRPNIVFFLADDLGYGDVGCFGQEKIRTPSVDRLAKEGMRLTQHYSGNAVCAPARCVLMTGKHPGHAFIRDNRQYQAGALERTEGQYPIPAGTITLARRLHDLGYATGGFGKWGLGAPETAGVPYQQGFDRFFGYNCQGVAHNYYPTHLWNNAERVPLANPKFSAHQKLPEGADPLDPASYAPYTGVDFAPDRIAAESLKFVRAHRDRPFFLYVPCTIPHLALQVPEDGLAEYRGKWPDEPYPGGKGYLPHRHPRAAYAAMVSRLDRYQGQIIDLVQELGLDERTIFVFSSDNGPLDNRYGGTDTDFFQSKRDLRGFKGSLYEGGVRVPTVVRWKGQIAAGKDSDRVTGFEDWFPTLLTLAGAADAIPAGLDGIDFSPTLRGETQRDRPFLYREFPSYGGQQSIRVGDWKAVRQGLRPRAATAAPNLRIELYNLRDDPRESKDVADQHPEVVARLEALMRSQHTPSAEFPLPALDPK